MEASRERSECVACELAAREPIFHRPEYARSRADLELMTADDFWEVGASGGVYTRRFVLDLLEERLRTPQEERLVVTDFTCRHLAGEVWLVTYCLKQDGGRISRRSTIWEHTGGDWRVVYHQGTLTHDIPPEQLSM